MKTKRSSGPRDPERTSAEFVCFKGSPASSMNHSQPFTTIHNHSQPFWIWGTWTSIHFWDNAEKMKKTSSFANPEKGKDRCVWLISVQIRWVPPPFECKNSSKKCRMGSPIQVYFSSTTLSWCGLIRPTETYHKSTIDPHLRSTLLVTYSSWSLKCNMHLHPFGVITKIPVICRLYMAVCQNLVPL